MLLPLALSSRAFTVTGIAVISAVLLLWWLMRSETREETSEEASERARRASSDAEDSRRISAP